VNTGQGSLGLDHGVVNTGHGSLEGIKGKGSRGKDHRVRDQWEEFTGYGKGSQVVFTWKRSLGWDHVVGITG
jgi:hypothetical protein